MIFEDELTDNFIQLLQTYEKHILMYAVYISQQNLTFNKLYHQDSPDCNLLLKEMRIKIAV